MRPISCNPIVLKFVWSYNEDTYTLLNRIQKVPSNCTVGCVLYRQQGDYGAFAFS
jgi:hypothetical protein